MFCMKCGKEIPDDSRVCGYCGNRIPLQAAARAPAIPAQMSATAPEQPLAVPAKMPAPAKAAEAARPKREAKRKFPLWGWVAIGAGAAVLPLVLILLLAKPTTELQLVGGCQGTFHAQTGDILELYYGYWGVVGDELIDENDELLNIQLHIAGTSYQGRRARPARTSEIPCATRGDYSDTQWNETQWLRDVFTVSLGPGTYDVLIVMSMEDAVSDGFDSDGDGVLDTYGPGEISRREYTLVVTD